MANDNELSAWLEQYDLDKYAELFAKHEIDLDVLPELGEADLVELGIPMGHRKKLLKAIRSLTAKQVDVPVPPQTPNVSPAGGHSLQSERRQLTVMICDLVGSTQLSQRFDPEELSTILTAYQHCCEQAIIENHGTITRYMGDGIFAYFGYPMANEIDAERAIHAGLDIVRKLDDVRPFDVRLETRVGIATGIVVIGDLVGEGPGQVEAVVGEAPNLAARLQALAEQGSVAIASTTRRLAEHAFDYQDLGKHSLKGFSEPIQAWKVIGESKLSTRSEVLGSNANLTPLVNREEELGVLKRRWKQATAGEGKAVLLSGEPGIGKSRLLQALRQEVASEPHTTMRCYCSPHYQNSILRPAIEFLNRLLDFTGEDTPAEKLDKLEIGLELTKDDLTVVAPLFAELLSIPAADRYPSVKLSPQGRKLRLLEALEAQLVRLSTIKPVLLIFEDLHWSDPTTIELLDRLLDRIHELPVLVLLTFRPEFSAPWSDYHYVSTITLNQLSPKDSSDLVHRLISDKALPNEVVEEILDKTDGNPLFIEELYKTVVDGNMLEDQGDHYSLSMPMSAVAVPSTLADSLMARLDRLNLVKEVAQTASVLGRRFSHDLLAHICDLDAPSLVAALNQLTEAQIVHCHGVGQQATYSFKHAMLQDAAYSSLLNRKRQALHGLVVEALEENYAATIEREPEVVAHHCSGAGLTDKAINYLQRAGQLAVRRSGNLEAVDHLKQALELLDRQDQSKERTQREFELLMAIGPAFSAARGFASPDVKATYTKALMLSRQLGDGSDDFPVLRSLWVYHFIRGELSEARELADQLMSLMENDKQTDGLMEAHRALGQTLLYQGDFIGARRHLEQSLNLYDPDQHGAGMYIYGNDSAVVCKAYLGFVLWFLGYPDQATTCCRETLQLARERDHPFTLALALAFAAYLKQHMRDVAATAMLAKETIAISEEQGFPFWAHQEAILLGWAMVEQGEINEGADCLRRGLDAYKAMGSGLACPWFLGLQAEVEAKTGDVDAALSTLCRAKHAAEETGEVSYLAEIYRLQATLNFTKRGDAAAKESEALYQQSFALARKQGSKSWELKTAIDQATLWQKLGRKQDASTLLKNIYSQFDEGFDTYDLKAARNLLEELNGGNT